jgi:DNA-binding NarL/FixJ family response regulator
MDTIRNISILVADTQFLTNAALISVLSPICHAVETVTTKADLHLYLQNNPVSIIITDYALLDFHSINELGELRALYPIVGIVVLTNSINHLSIKELNDAGISNIILKTDDREELFHAITAAQKGKKYYSENVLDILLKKEGTLEDAHLLTPSEIDIVRQIAVGLTTKQIAARKHISFHTVTTHRKNIFRKLCVTSSSELLMHAIKAGLIDNIEYHI